MSTYSVGLSVVMIARNAAKYLVESLTALSGIADEIVVVDTGSTDETEAIARNHASRVISFPWQDDFSLAKNFAIDHARYRWILSVDSDEVLDTEGVQAILAEAMADEETPAYLVYQDNVLDSGVVEPNRVLRLFRNDPRIRFTNPVHECITGTLFITWPDITLKTLDVHLRHYGFLRENAHGKHERNRAILERWVAGEPEHVFANFKLGGTLLSLGRADEALVCLERVFSFFTEERNRRRCPYLAVFTTCYERALLAAGQIERANRFVQIAAHWSPVDY